MFDRLKNKLLYANKYHTHSEAVIVSCFFNPQNSPYRLSAFQHFYEQIKHLNHHIVECVIGDTKPQLQAYRNIKTVYTKNLLWHKESLLNNIIAELPSKFKYIFWVDADVLFTNLDWMVEGVEELQLSNIIQPFEYCVHLKKDENNPSFNLDTLKSTFLPNQLNDKVWRSFCANFVTNHLWKDEVYNNHGHVGFAWGARRSVLDTLPLYDKALIGGADHIIAHAAAGQIPHSCITKAFTDNLDEVNEWSTRFYKVVEGKIGYVKGDLYHLWHGDIENREYLKRIQDFTAKTKEIVEKDENGLYVSRKEDDAYMTEYFRRREAWHDNHPYHSNDNQSNVAETGMAAIMLAGIVNEQFVNQSVNDKKEQKENEEKIDSTIHHHPMQNGDNMELKDSIQTSNVVNPFS
jgi:hypothetical protein